LFVFSTSQTTFVRVLTGEQTPDSGTVKVGDTILLGVYDQLGLKVEDPEQTVLEFVLDCVRARPVSVDNNNNNKSGGGIGSDSGSNNNAGVVSEAVAPDEARRLLKQFEFPRQRWNDRIAVLSGGEKRRLQMLSVLSQRPNFLVMDEPSVDCDLNTLQALEKYLREEYTGVLVIVSHDRSFADKVTDHLFVFEGNGEIKDFEGTLSEYASTLVDLENDKIVAEQNQQQQQQLQSSSSSSQQQLGYKEDRAKRNEQRNAVRKAKKDMDQLERAMDKLRAQAAALQTEIDGSSQAGWSVLADLTDRLHKIQNDLDEKELRWMELAESVEEAEVEV